MCMLQLIQDICGSLLTLHNSCVFKKVETAIAVWRRHYCVRDLAHLYIEVENEYERKNSHALIVKGARHGA